MKKWITMLLSFCLLFGMTACSTGETETSSITEQNSENQMPNEKTEITLAEGSETFANQVADKSGSNILIAYFTWAENTQVENPDEVDVDATTSASVLLPGNAAQIAAWIQQKAGGDLFPIIVSEPYSSDYDECLDRAANEKAENARPELVNHVDNMDEYDVIFLGYAGGIIGLNQEKPTKQGFALI